jgi:probable F420-dependent oxidoreductase
MKFGVTLAMLRPSLWVETAALADRLGFESVWVPEHLVLPVQLSGSPYSGHEHPPVPPTTPVFDVFTMLAFIAARTTQIRLGTNVYNIGLRHPFVTARAVTTLDILSNGRVELGVGASWLAEEWSAVGLDFASRGGRVDEAIGLCRRLWSEHEITHDGEHFRFDPVMFEPKPVQQGGPPIAVGGDSPRALRRVAELGDGWIPMNTPVTEVAARRADIERMRTDRGRDPSFTLTMHGGWPGTDEVERLREAGVDRVIVSPWRRSAEAADGLTAFAAEFLQPSPR